MESILEARENLTVLNGQVRTGGLIFLQFGDSS